MLRRVCRSALAACLANHNTSRLFRKMLQNEREPMAVAKANGLAARLQDAERERGIVVAPGVYDALSAGIAAAAGFDTLYLSGAAIAYCRLGRPGYRAGVLDRGRRDDCAGARPRRLRADRRCRHRLRQRAQRPAHGAAVRAGRGLGDPARGSGVPEALRASRRQGASSPRPRWRARSGRRSMRGDRRRR